MQGDELSNFFPASFGKKSSSSAPKSQKGATASGGSDLDWDAFRNQMPLAFGKQKEQKDLRLHFAKTKRTEEEEAGDVSSKDAGGELPGQSDGVKRLKQDDGLPISNKTEHKEREGNEDGNDEDDDEEEEEEEDEDEDDANDGKELMRAETLPISHEIKLNDHHKVCLASTSWYLIRNLLLLLILFMNYVQTVSALTLDPSGARLITGGYDYDVKFWDFAGMDGSLRPFRSIEPCGGHQIHDLHYSLTGDSFLIVPGSSRPKIYDRDGFEMEWGGDRG
ncbi:hypothetical protein BC937DRAFT_91777 [Endogone sp. FLAS-F59071]|nr:hypothetical protein BC937DRAFT_91777 [Endogone sp. FLAS-F59071]|eukprot:RUS15942.1 hypothetical protein BC937DRAFT_91777 [Endogone sp. FLAS-F59071]